MVLKALGKQDEKLLRLNKPRLCKDKLIVNGNEGPSHLVFADANTFPNQNQ